MKLRSILFPALVARRLGAIPLGAGLLVAGAAPATVAARGHPGWQGGWHGGWHGGYYWHGGWYPYPGYYGYAPYYYPPPVWYGPPAVTFAVPGVSVTIP